MSFKNKLIKNAVLVLAASVMITACKKLDRPKLGDYPKDATVAGGPLKFYVAFDGTTNNPLMNAVDSIKANFPSSNPLASIDGISRKAVQGAFDKAIKYASANDFANSTSFSISFWIKNTPWAGGPGFVFSLTNKDYWHNSALFLLIEDQGLSSTSAAQMSFVVEDNWFVFDGANKWKNLLNGSWHHLVFTYDETTSKLAYYLDGAQLTGLPSNLTDFGPKGPLKLTDASGSQGSFVIGGWNKHAGLDGPGDAWIQGFNGGIDQFRLYSKALSPAEVLALFNSKQ